MAFEATITDFFDRVLSVDLHLDDFVRELVLDARLECSLVVDHQPDFDVAPAACKFKKHIQTQTLRIVVKAAY
nr:hypothetical protein [Tanacetum cinerariifolium]